MKTDITLLVNEALTTLEENIPSDQVSELPTSADILESLVEESVQTVLCIAPANCLTGVLGLGNQITWETETTGHIMLPEDFFRLIEFRMSDWKRSVFSAVSPGTAEYDCLSDEPSPWRGSVDFPAVAIVSTLNGKILRFNSCLNDLAKVETFMYLPLPVVDADGRIEIPPLCHRAVIYEMSHRFCMLRCDNDRAQAFLTLRNSTFNTQYSTL